MIEPRTRRWAPDEYVMVDGAPRVYDYDGYTGRLTVRLPGCTKATVGELRTLGRVVTMPGRIRMPDEVPA